MVHHHYQFMCEKPENQPTPFPGLWVLSAKCAQCNSAIKSATWAYYHSLPFLVLQCAGPTGLHHYPKDSDKCGDQFPRLAIISVQELNFAQIYTVFTLLTNIPLVFPPAILNWTMTLQPDGSWRRKTTTLGIPTPSGDYTLRNIITGEGEKRPYFDAWVKSRGGRPFAYIDRIP